MWQYLYFSSNFTLLLISAQGPWDQEKFEQLIAEWVVSCDQPFEEVDRPQFRETLMYTHHPAPEPKIPHRDAIRRRIMKMGEDSVEATKEMFAVSNNMC
jgi:hypothetical protein